MTNKETSEEKIAIENDSDSKAKQVEKTKVKFSLFEVIIFIVAFAIIFCLLGYVIGNHNKKDKDKDYVAISPSKEIETFIEQYNYILNNYYGDINKEELIEAAIQGMLSSLDDYSGFIGEESNSFNVTLTGSYEGVGIEISNDLNGDIVIRKVYEDTPAAKAGLKENDIVKECNDIDMHGKTSSELVSMITSDKEAVLTILRGNETFKVTVKKEIIILKSVNYRMLEDKIGYISMNIFASNTYAQFKEALDNLEKDGMKSLIIDVRNNGGGYLTTADSIISLFMDASHVMYQTENKEKTEKFYSKGTTNKEYPIVVLQNGNSASASEILTSALQEQLNAYVVGNTSYGKGTVQQLQSVSGMGQYKFTTKKWLTSNGTWINKVGIKPDYEVSLEATDYTTIDPKDDTQLQAGIKYLQNK